MYLVLDKGGEAEEADEGEEVELLVLDGRAGDGPAAGGAQTAHRHRRLGARVPHL